MKWKHRRGDPSAYSALAIVRNDLLDLGLNNPLLNYAEEQAHGIANLHIDPVRIVSQLVVMGGQCVLRPGTSGGRGAVMAGFVSPESFYTGQTPIDALSAVPQDLPVITELTEHELNRRLTKAYYHSRGSLEAEGCITLYICLGLLRWRGADEQDSLNNAPLLLIPVQLERSSVAAEFRLTYSGDTILANDCLAESMKAFDIEIPPLPDTRQPDILGYFKAVQHAVLRQSSWYVDADTVSLGLFSLSRLSVYKDLNPDIWPNNSLIEHPLVNVLLEGGSFVSTIPDQTDKQYFDERVASSIGTQVLDADSSQVQAILAVSRGESLVIQGPPGTGKSQTIVNIIANAVAAGKRILFVSEKIAALEVVKRRLNDVGLGETVLELHSDRTRRADLFNQLKQTLDLRLSAAMPEHAGQHLNQEAFVSARKRLNDYCAAVNSTIEPSGETAYSIYGKLQKLTEGLNLSTLPPLDLPEAATWDPSHVQCCHQAIDQIQMALRSPVIPRSNAFWGISAIVLTPSTREKIRATLHATKVAMEQLLQVRSSVVSALGAVVPRTWQELYSFEACVLALQSAPTIAGLSLRSPIWLTQLRTIQDFLSAGEELSALEGSTSVMMREDAWNRDTSGLREEIQALQKRWWKPTSNQINVLQRQIASMLLNPAPDDLEGMLSVLAMIERHQSLRRRLETVGSPMPVLFGRHWKGHLSDWPLLRQQFEWVIATANSLPDNSLPAWMSARVSPVNPVEVRRLGIELNQAIRTFQEHQSALRVLFGIPDESSDLSLVTEAGEDLERLGEAYAVLMAKSNELDVLSRYLRVREDVLPVLGENVLQISDTWKNASKCLLELFEYYRLSAILQCIFAVNTNLLSFDAEQHSRSVVDFRTRDIAGIQATRKSIAAAHLANLSADGRQRDTFEILLSMSAVRSSLPSIRRAMDDIPEAIQAVKPVFMMSPNSIASFLPPGRVHFDLVIFDEASQLRPAEALGAIARGTQAIVVGDSKQLPPTRLVDKRSLYDLDVDIQSLSDVESILGLFCARNSSQLMLRWHYRSKHESLIALSNHMFYDDRMIVFPSPDRRRIGVGLTCFPIQVASSDSDETARETEARAIAVYVIQHITEQSTKPHEERLTLGVAALNPTQRDRIIHQLDIHRYSRPDLDIYFSSEMHEPFFVKTLESVQGDERDVILISVGYGQPANGTGIRNLGTLVREGGERRLNVLFTRARRRCEVFTTIKAAAIEISEHSPDGLLAFKRFLNYIEFGRINRPPILDATPAAPFEAQVANIIEQAGYTVQRRVGLAGFYLDLAIVDPKVPERYVMGILCDGPTYAEAFSSRDRDRLREQALLDIGWELYRVWSTAWYLDRDREIKKLTAALAAATARSNISDPLPEVNDTQYASNLQAH